MSPDKEHIASLKAQAASRFNVAAATHPEDMIYKFIIENKSFTKTASAINYYYSVGNESANNLISILRSLDVEPRGLSLLEFASGYGCVSRHLAKMKEQFSLASSDIHPQALEFMRTSLGIEKVIASANDPKQFQCGEQFDVVFALSFFSHMPQSTWGRWLKTLYEHVRPGGYLIFTTQGLTSAQYLGNPPIPADGFWFSPTSEQKDLDVSEYGQTICTLEWVYRQVRDLLQVPLTYYRAGYWWGHQDVYAIAKPGNGKSIASQPPKIIESATSVAQHKVRLPMSDEEIWRRVADKHFVRNIAKNDSMAFGIDSEKVYYWMGFTAIDAITEGLARSNTDQSNIKTILDFACGYGRVCRALRSTFPGAAITACDIDRGGVAFCAENFGALPAYSHEKPEDLTLTGQYDLIWVGSLFTHLPESDWRGYLQKLCDLTAPNGLLVFSVAGRFVYDLAVAGDYFGLRREDMAAVQADYQKRGFAYAQYPNTVTSHSNIGRTFVSDQWVKEEIANIASMRYVCNIERGYSQRQDVIVASKQGHDHERNSA